jgi:hypothetical protein
LKPDQRLAVIVSWYGSLFGEMQIVRFRLNRTVLGQVLPFAPEMLFCTAARSSVCTGRTEQADSASNARF